MDYMKTLREKATTMHEALSQLDDIYSLLAVLGFTLDYWAYEKNVSAEELERGLNGLYEASVAAHKELGMPQERYGEERW